MRRHDVLALIFFMSCTPSVLAQQPTIPTSILQVNPAAVQALREVIDAQNADRGETEERPAFDPALLSRIGDASAIRQTVIAAGPRTLDPGQSVYVKRDEPARPLPCSPSREGGQCMESQISYITTTMAQEVVNLSLVWESTERLRMSGGNGFGAELFLQLRNVDAPNTEQELSGPIQVAVSAPVDAIDPGPIIEFDRTNRFLPVTLSVSSPEDPTLVRLAPSGTADSQEITFLVTRPTLDLSIGRQSILGFGLETTTVSVRANGVDSPAGTVSLTTRLGNTNLNNVPFDGNLATTFVRSSGTGSDTIVARLANFEDATATVDYRMPWSWLIAVLIGAVVGMALRMTMQARTPGGRDGLAFNVVLGLIGGLLTAVLYGLGVNILPLPLPGGFSEGLAFVLSAIGAWVFPKWLAGLAPGQAGGG